MAVVSTFAEVVMIDVEPDGIVFEPSSIAVTPIREEDAYGGKRVTIAGHLGPAKLKIQIDIGSGDAVYPDPEWIDYPVLLELPRPRLRAYRQETAIAEKLHAMIALGSKNSRMRDFFDVHALASREPFDGHSVARAIRTTFERRATPIPVDVPLALRREFAAIEGKHAQWTAFVRKNGLPRTSLDFNRVIAEVAVFLAPVLKGLARDKSFDATWPPGGPWQ